MGVKYTNTLLKGVILLVIIIVTGCSVLTMSGSGQYVVGLDNYYNHEIDAQTGEPYHYIWSDTAMSGYSQLGTIFNSYGADTMSVATAPTDDILDDLSVYIIVDPDTPRETSSPKYLAEPAIGAIEDWVNDGGVLVLLANNGSQCEFEHLNELAGAFGITFNADNLMMSTPQSMELSTFDTFPDHRMFEGVSRLFIKEISSLTLTAPAEPLFVNDGHVIMAKADVGTGMVFALGDPWLYNEYINIQGWDNLQAATNLVTWLIEESSPVKQ